MKDHLIEIKALWDTNPVFRYGAIVAGVLFAGLFVLQLVG